MVRKSREQTDLHDRISIEKANSNCGSSDMCHSKFFICPHCGDLAEIIHDVQTAAIYASCDLHEKNRTTTREERTMKYVCDVCGWEYDETQGYPEAGIAPGTKWEDLPEDFECPLCGVGKDMFSEE